jgi:hypothetical protein
MLWALDRAVAVAAIGAATYALYLVFLAIVLFKDGPDAVEKIAKVVPVPRWIASRKAASVPRRRTPKAARNQPESPELPPSPGNSA